MVTETTIIVYPNRNMRCDHPQFNDRYNYIKYPAIRTLRAQGVKITFIKLIKTYENCTLEMEAKLLQDEQQRKRKHN